MLMLNNKNIHLTRSQVTQTQDAIDVFIMKEQFMDEVLFKYISWF